MSFKTTVRSQRITHFVASSALGLAKSVGQRLQEKLEPLLEDGEMMPDFELVQNLVGRYLERRGRELLAADDRHSGNKSHARDLRLERTRLTEELRLGLRDVRFFFDRQHGKERTRAFLPKRTFSKLDAPELLRIAHQAVQLLRDPERNTTLRGPAVRRAAELAEALQAQARELGEVLDRQEGEQARKSEGSLAEKTAVLRKSERDIRSGSNLLAGFYLFADLPFHARRIRRRVNRKAATTDIGPAAPSPDVEKIIPAEPLSRTGRRRRKPRGR